jgi:hypothetical protein
MAIAQELDAKLEQNALHNVVSLRNAFAHQATDAHPVFYVGGTPEADEVGHELQIVTSPGKVTRRRRDAALAEFNSSYAAAKKSLVALLSLIRTVAPPNSVTP